MAIRSFMPFAYVAYLWGDNVFNGHSNVCLFENFSEFDDVRKLIKEKYNLEFTEFATSFCGSGYQVFNNITDDRDIKLVIDRVDIINVKKN